MENIKKNGLLGYPGLLKSLYVSGEIIGIHKNEAFGLYRCSKSKKKTDDTATRGEKNTRGQGPMDTIKLSPASKNSLVEKASFCSNSG